MASLKKNIVLNYINTITGIIFPIITFPYASRILNPEGIGIVNFYNSIISYIVLLTSLGIPLYAVKEVAKYRDDIYKRNKVTVELTLLSLILCLFGYIIVILIGIFIPHINENLVLFYILSSSILFNALGIQWFYQGIEDFHFITIRALIIRTLAALSLFIFVKEKSDIIPYGLITIGSTVGNNLINFIHLRKFISCSFIKEMEIDLYRHLKPTIRIFILNVIISIYVQLNTIMLGFLDGDYAVGIYSAGNKLPHMLLSVVTSMSAVMLPRCSNLIINGKLDEFANVIKKSINLVLMLSLPLTFGLIILAKPIIYIFCGSSFIDAIPVVCWTSPIILFIALTNIIGIQILYPLGKENIVICSTLIGAMVNLVLNIILIPRYSTIGVSISTFIAELSVLFMQVCIGRKYFPTRLFDKHKLHYLIGAIIMCFIIIPVIVFIKGYLLQVVISCVLGILFYGMYLIIIKDAFIIGTINQLSRNKYGKI